MYKQIKNPNGLDCCITRMSDGACIPFDPDNVDFQQYQKWLSKGNQPIPADEPNA